jgi:hypothetical protein
MGSFRHIISQGFGAEHERKSKQVKIRLEFNFSHANT